MTRIAIIQGHPDPNGQHLCHGLAHAYAAGAEGAGHEVQEITVARLDFPLLRTKDDFENGEPPPDIAKAQDTIHWAEHLVILYPLWLGTMPALLKGFLEQVFRAGFAMHVSDDGRSWTRLLKGKSARVVVTMGMPAFFYRLWFRAHSLKSLEKNVLKFSGIKPVRESLYGLVENVSDKKRGAWLDEMRELGNRAR